MNALSIDIHHLSKRFGDKKVINNLDINFDNNKISVIISPSGSGKTTLLNIIAGLMDADSGEIKKSSNKISYVFQESRLFPFMNVMENILIINNNKNVSKESEEKKIKKILNFLGLVDVYTLMPRELSGGMAMRVSIARAIYNEPDILLLDEAFSGLDINLIEKISSLIKKEKSTTVIMVTHDIELAVDIADNIFVFTGSPLEEYQKFEVLKWNKKELTNKIKSYYKKIK